LVTEFFDVFLFCYDIIENHTRLKKHAQSIRLEFHEMIFVSDHVWLIPSSVSALALI
jgi:hypothetical protein